MDASSFSYTHRDETMEDYLIVTHRHDTKVMEGFIGSRYSYTLLELSSYNHNVNWDLGSSLTTCLLG